MLTGEEISQHVGLKNSKAVVQERQTTQPPFVSPVSINSPDHREEMRNFQTPLNGGISRLEKNVSSSEVIPMRDDFKEF